jgi:hypothetical protein
MFALSALYEGFARGLVSLHTPPLLGRKPSSAKSRVSISSKLIEIKGFQLHYFGHLRKTGGRGSYQLPTRHPLFPPHSPLVTRLLLSPLFPLHTNSSLVCLMFPLLTQKQGGVLPRKNVGAPTFLIFPLISRTFSLPPRSAALTQDRRNGKRAGMKASATVKHEEICGDTGHWTHSRHFPPPVCYITTVLRAYCASPSQNGTYQNPVYFPGARPAGMSLFAYRCPDADD